MNRFFIAKSILALLIVLFFLQNGFSQTSEIDSLNNLLKQEEDLGKRLNLILDITEINLNDEPVNSTSVLDSVYNIAIDDQYKSVQGRVYFLKGKIYINQMNLPAAFEHLDKARNIFEELDNVEYIKKSLVAMADAYSANENYEKSIDCIQLINDKYVSKKDKLGKANCKVRIGIFQFYLGDTIKAKLNYLSALKYYKDIEHYSGMSRCYNNIGIMCADLDSAVFYLEKALVYFEKAGDYNVLSHGHSNIAVFYERKKDYRNAKKHLLKALAIKKILNNKKEEIEAANNLSRFYNSVNNPDRSIILAKKCLEEVVPLNLPVIEQDILANLVEGYKTKNDYKMAFFYLKRMKEKRDTIYRIENSKLIHEMQTKFEVEKVENENLHLKEKAKKDRVIRNIAIITAVLSVFSLFLVINRYKLKRKLILKDKQFLEEQVEKDKIIILQKETQAKLEKEEHLRIQEELKAQESIRLMNIKLKEEIATKDKFFSIISHDLKNPFSAIVEFSNMLINDFDKYPKEKMLHYISLIRDSSKQTYDLLQNLLYWSRQQTGRIEFKPRAVMLNEMFSKIKDLFIGNAIQKNIDLKINCENNIRISADENMLQTLLRNLISNAIKFTNLNGEVNLNACLKSNDVIIEVKDNGIGMGPDELDKIFKLEEKFSQLGTNNEAGTGLGLVLCEEIVAQHNGIIDVESEIGKGTVFIVTLPKELN